MLKPLKDFAKIYIDDIVSFSNFFEIYIHYFRQFLTKLNVILITKKIFELSQHHFFETKKSILSGCQ